MTDRSDLIPMIEHVAARLGRPFRMVEVGVFRGDSARVFLASPHVAQYIGVDPWRGGYDPDDASSKELEREAAAIKAEAFKVIGASLKGSILCMTGGEAAVLAESSVDFVYLDAAHDYESVGRDIFSWIFGLSIIGGHDYEEGWPGVKRAVDEAFPRVKLFGTNWRGETRWNSQSSHAPATGPSPSTSV